MKPTDASLRVLAHSVFAIVFASIIAASVPVLAQQQPPVKDNEIRGTVASANGAEAGVWVIAETFGPADSIFQDRRHGRPRPLSDPGLAKGQLLAVDARLWFGGRSEGAERAGQTGRPGGNCRPRR